MTTVAGFDLKGFDELMQKFERLKEKSLKNGKANNGNIVALLNCNRFTIKNCIRTTKKRCS